MKNMNMLSKLVATLVLFGASIGSANAMYINGTISYVGPVSNDGSTLTFTGSTNVSVATGDFATAGIVFGTAVTTAPSLDYDPQTLPVIGLWSVGGFSFDLLSIHSVIHDGADVIVKGLGSLAGAGFDDTVYSWEIATTGSGVSFTASSEFVPEPATLALMGLGLVGLGAVRRYKSA